MSGGPDTPPGAGVNPPAPGGGGREAPFFVGYLPVPRGLGGFLARLVVVVLVAAGTLGLGLSATEPDPGGGAFRFDLGPQTLVGVVRATPYGTVTLTEPAGAMPVGHTVMLAGVGKTGVRDRAAPLDGQVARVTGILLARGDLDMMQVDGPDGGMVALATAAPPGANGGVAAPPGATPDAAAGGVAAVGAAAAPGAPSGDEDRGRWRVTGEICDGKCLAGAMRPGTGLSHKACANLCLVGDIPPVLVTTGPVEGRRFLLLAGPDGGPISPALLDRTAVLVEVEGRLTRRGDLMILTADPASVRVW